MIISNFCTYKAYIGLLFWGMIRIGMWPKVRQEDTFVSPYKSHYSVELISEGDSLDQTGPDWDFWSAVNHPKYYTL